MKKIRFSLLGKKKFLFGIFCILINFSANALGPIDGKVIDAKNNKPLANVHIDIIGKNISTVSDNNGNFTISLPDKYNEDKLCIYIKGYQPKMYKVADLKKKCSNSTILITKEEYIFEMQPVSSPIINEDSPKLNRYGLEPGTIY